MAAPTVNDRVDLKQRQAQPPAGLPITNAFLEKRFSLETSAKTPTFSGHFSVIGFQA